MASQTRVEYHDATARHFMEKAWEYLAEDDLLQASEKGWGAAAQAVKAAAESRGWEHDGHRQLFQAISRLADETGDGQLKSLFHSANSVHINFYDGLMNREMVETALYNVDELVGKLEPLQQ